MSWLTDTFLFGVTVLVATLQSATSRRKPQLADDTDHDKQFSFDSIGTKEEKKTTQQ